MEIYNYYRCISQMSRGLLSNPKHDKYIFCYYKHLWG